MTKVILFLGAIAFVFIILNGIWLVVYLIEIDIDINSIDRNLKLGTYSAPISLLHLWNPKILEKTASVDFFKNNSFDQQKESISKQANNKQTTSKVIIGISYIILTLAWLKFLS